MVLRPWQDGDRGAFVEMMAAPHIVQFLGPAFADDPLAALDRHIDYRASHGLGFWAVERRADGALIGQCGLKPGGEGTPIEGLLEIGWALGSAGLGQGYALEAARATLGWAWANRREAEVVAITSAINVRSRAVMERLDMVRDIDGDFDHPVVPDGSPLKRHVTFRIARPAQI
nr:GNAT family N-acetyltransferase [Sphingomonas japonica]